jgi:hypothetical protein
MVAGRILAIFVVPARDLTAERASRAQAKTAE